MPRRSNLVLTDKRVRSLKPKEREYEVSDARLPGFGLRVTPYGLKTFFYRYHERGQRRRKSLGVYDESGDLARARREAEAIRGLTVLGKTPESSHVAETGSITFGEVARRWIEEYAKPNKKSWRSNVRALERDVYPSWDRTPIASIRPADVRDLLLGVAKRSGSQANGVHSIIRTIFNWAFEAETIDSNPASIKPVFKAKPPQTILSDEDLATLWPVWLEQQTLTGAAFCLYLLTGVRNAELRTLEWSQVFTDRFELPVTKNDKPHTVYLSTQAQTIFAAIREVTSFSKWVFPSSVGRDSAISSFHPYLCWYRQQYDTGDWTLHALRRTASTILAREGASSTIIDVFLNHLLKDVTHRHYVCYRYADQVREATQGLGDFVEKIAGPVKDYRIPEVDYGPRHQDR